MKNWWFNATNILEREGYDSVTIRVEDVSRANDIVGAIAARWFSGAIAGSICDRRQPHLTVVTMMFTLIGGIALLVATIGIANTMVMAIYERTREIGILKAMGASRGEIRQMFMLEAGFIGMIGGVVGLLIGWLLGLGLNQAIDIFPVFGNCPCTANSFWSRRAGGGRDCVCDLYRPGGRIVARATRRETRPAGSVAARVERDG